MCYGIWGLYTVPAKKSTTEDFCQVLLSSLVFIRIVSQIFPITYKLITYYQPVCYFLRVLQYPVNTTYNIATSLQMVHFYGGQSKNLCSLPAKLFMSKESKKWHAKRLVRPVKFEETHRSFLSPYFKVYLPQFFLRSQTNILFYFQNTQLLLHT